MNIWNMKSGYPAKLALSAARQTSTAWCSWAVRECEILDRRMKSERGVDPVADVDEVTDLAHAISCMRAIREAAKRQPLFVPHRTLSWVEYMGLKVTTPPNDNHDPRDYLDGPAGDEQRIAEGMDALRESRLREFDYERSKYNNGEDELR